MEDTNNSYSPESVAAELERCGHQTQVHAAELLRSPTPEQPLREALRETHALHRLAASIQAWGLAGLGADFHKLLEIAADWLPTDREKASEIFQFILDRQQDWFVINQFTSMEMWSEALDIYQGMRGMIEERWPGRLPPAQSGVVASAPEVPPEVAELLATPESRVQAAPESEDSPEYPVPSWATSVVPDAEILAVQEPAEQFAAIPFSPVLPWLLAVMPPALQLGESTMTPSRAVVRETNRDVRQESPIAQKSNPVKAISPSVALPRGNKPAAAPNLARPWLVPVVPPTLHRAEARTG